MSQVLFCPFCRESHEDLSLCPEHELRLVPWKSLPALTEPEDDHRRLSAYAMSHGRAWVFAGAMLGLLAFVLPLAEMRGEQVRAGTMLALAMGRAPRLWLVVAACAGQLTVLLRRRTPIAMRGARLAIPILALVPVVVLAITLKGSYEAAALMEAKTGMGVSLRPASGAYLTVVASLLSLVGGARLGLRGRPRPPRVG